MKKENKIFKKALGLILTVLSICAALTGCANNKIKGISLSEVDTPRLIYMLGEELDLSRGTVIATYNKEEKNIPLSDGDVSVSGYDKTKLGKQTLTVSYSGKSLQYEITVYSSAVQAIHDTAEKLKNADLSGDGINLTAEYGEVAFSAMREYLGLSESEKALVEKEKLDVIVVPAALHASKIYNAELSKLADTFSVDGKSGNIIFAAEKYENAKSDLWTLEDKTQVFNLSRDLLLEIKSRFADYKLPSGTPLGLFINPISEEKHSFAIEALRLITSIHQSLIKIPTDWKTSELANYENGILRAVNLIEESDFVGPDFRYLYDFCKGWRDKKDTFDIIYSYYCYVAEDGRILLKDGLWQTIPLPDMLWDWYSPLYNAAKEAVLMAENKNEAYTLHDTTSFMLLYRDILLAKEKIDSSNDALAKDVYAAIYGDAVFENNVRRSYGGYITHTGGMLGNEAYYSLWAKYLEIISLEKQNLLDFEEHAELMKELFDDFTSLTPSEVYGFISSLNFLYRESGGEVTVLNPDKTYNRFSVILNDFYQSKLPESLKPTFKNLLDAIENYAIYSLRGEESGAKAGFENAIESIEQTLATINAEDAASFNSLLGKCYNKYHGIYSYELGSVALKDKFDALHSTLSAYFELVNTGTVPEMQSTVYTLLFSLYERANSIYGEILSSKNEAAVTELYCKRYSIAEEELTLDAAFYVSRTVFISNLVSILLEDEDTNKGIKPLLFDVYFETKLGEFLKDASYVLEYKALNKSTVKSVMESFRNLGTKEKKLFYTIGASVYYNNLERFFSEQFPSDENAKEFIRAILEAEYAYFSYTSAPTNEEYFDSFKKKMLSAISYYALIADHNTRDAYFLSTYEYYTEIYYGLNK